MLQLHKNKAQRLIPVRSALLLLILVFSLDSCGGKGVVTGESPFVRVTALMLTEHWLEVEISVRNMNTTPLQMDLIRFQLRIGEKTEVNYDSALDANVVANGSERLSFRIDVPPDEARSRLEALEAGEIISVPYDLEGEVQETGAGTLKFKNEGHVYAVPGRPGHFR
jgi:hypothetical protein